MRSCHLRLCLMLKYMLIILQVPEPLILSDSRVACKQHFKLAGCGGIGNFTLSSPTLEGTNFSSCNVQFSSTYWAIDFGIQLHTAPPPPFLPSSPAPPHEWNLFHATAAFFSQRAGMIWGRPQQVEHGFELRAVICGCWTWLSAWPPTRGSARAEQQKRLESNGKMESS